jgi:hypothetical protein
MFKSTASNVIFGIKVFIFSPMFSPSSNKFMLKTPMTSMRIIHSFGISTFGIRRTTIYRERIEHFLMDLNVVLMILDLD